MVRGGCSPTRPISQEGEAPLGTGGPPRDSLLERSWGTPRTPYWGFCVSLSPFPASLVLAGRGPLWAGHPEGEDGLRRPSCLQCRPPKGPGASLKGPWNPLLLFPVVFCLFCLQEGAYSPPGPRVQKGRSRPFGPLPPLQCRHPRGLGTPGGSPKAARVLWTPLLCFPWLLVSFFWLSPAGDFAPLWTQGPEGGSRPIGPFSPFLAGTPGARRPLGAAKGC